jgi:PAS domain S-box-containing protein
MKANARAKASAVRQDDFSDFFDNAAIPLHWVDGSGIIVHANDAELRLLGYERDEYIGRPIAEFHADGEAIADILTRLARRETLRDYPSRLRCKDGSVRTVRITSNVKWGEDGRFLHTRCITREVDEQREELRNRLAAIVESSDDAIISKSVDGIVESWNRGAETLYGYTAVEAIGRSIMMLIPEELRAEEAMLLERLRRGERVDHYETVRLGKNGKRIDVSLTISPIRDGAGRIVGASKIARDITARKQAEETLREADRRKDDFLAMLAHELRNPLAPIRASVEVLCLEGIGAEHVARAKSIIERQVSHMVRLVDDLLDVSRISRGKVTLQKEPVDLSAAILAAIETSRPAIEAGKHRFTIALADEPLVVEGDYVRLSQIALNLLNNAAKFTDSGGRISLAVRREGAHAVVAVQDSGVGIAPDMLERVFEMFVQGHRPGSESKSGLGIGLALARNLALLHGGELRAASEGPGKGATFELRLPLLKGARPEPAASREEPKSVRLPAKRVLVVDDNVDAAESLAMMLSAMGHDVEVAHGGRAALERARAARPDVVLLDIGMPDLDGLEVARRMRREPALRHVRLAALTGFGQKGDIERSRQAGFDEHLVKPVSPEVLRLVIGQ